MLSDPYIFRLEEASSFAILVEVMTVMPELDRTSNVSRDKRV